MAGVRFANLKRGSVQTKSPQVNTTNIYEGLVTRNITEHTYTTAVNGKSIPLYYMARTTTGDMLRSDTPTFSSRQPKGMLLRTNEGPVTVHKTTR